MPFFQGIVGNLSSGKSALVHRYLTGTYVQEESPEGKVWFRGRVAGVLGPLLASAATPVLHIFCPCRWALRPPRLPVRVPLRALPLSLELPLCSLPKVADLRRRS